MAKGNSGRLVIEIDPDLKQELYQALGNEGLNLKQWFLENVADYLEHQMQPGDTKPLSCGIAGSPKGFRNYRQTPRFSHLKNRL